MNLVWSLTGESASFQVERGRILSKAAPTGPAEGWALPGFIDDHCHILPTGLDLARLTLAGCNSREEALDLLRDGLANVPEDRWLYAVHYDQNRFPDGRHLTLAELDAISSDRPILARHVNGHASVANSAALKRAGVRPDEPDPEGGKYGRDESGNLDGSLLENAHERVTAAVPSPGFEEMVEAILRAGDAMAAYGIVAACDMQTGRFDLDLELQAYAEAGRRGGKIATRLYLQWKTVLGPRAIAPARLQELVQELPSGRSGMAGVKIFADGAIGSATAAIYGEYTGATANGPRVARHGKDASKGREGVSGQLIYAPDRLKDMVRLAHEAGHAVSIHSIGDYATDLVLDAYEALDDPARHRIEHAMLMSPAQIARLKRLGTHLSVQPEFLVRFRHAYLRQLGPEKASKLNPIRSVLDAGIETTFSSDRPIVSGNPWDGIRTAENRPEGFDPAENCTRLEALTAYCQTPLKWFPELADTIQVLPFDPLTQSPQ